MMYENRDKKIGKLTDKIKQRIRKEKAAKLKDGKQDRLIGNVNEYIERQLVDPEA